MILLDDYANILIKLRIVFHVIKIKNILLCFMKSELFLRTITVSTKNDQISNEIADRIFICGSHKSKMEIQEIAVDPVANSEANTKKAP